MKILFPWTLTSVLSENDIENNADIDQLSKVCELLLTKLAYIIFTSGSTGTPKAVSNKINTLNQIIDLQFCRSKAQVRHYNFTEFIYSLVYIDTFTEHDLVGSNITLFI